MFKHLQQLVRKGIYLLAVSLQNHGTAKPHTVSILAAVQTYRRIIAITQRLLRERDALPADERRRRYEEIRQLKECQQEAEVMLLHVRASYCPESRRQLAVHPKRWEMLSYGELREKPMLMRMHQSFGYAEIVLPPSS